MKIAATNVKFKIKVKQEDHGYGKHDFPDLFSMSVGSNKQNRNCETNHSEKAVF